MRAVAEQDADLAPGELRDLFADLVVRDAECVGERHPGTGPIDAGIDDSGAPLDEADELELADGLHVRERLALAPRGVDKDEVMLIRDRQGDAARVGVAGAFVPERPVGHGKVRRRSDTRQVERATGRRCGSTGYQWRNLDVGRSRRSLAGPGPLRPRRYLSDVDDLRGARGGSRAAPGTPLGSAHPAVDAQHPRPPPSMP